MQSTTAHHPFELHCSPRGSARDPIKIPLLRDNKASSELTLISPVSRKHFARHHDIQHPVLKRIVRPAIEGSMRTSIAQSWSRNNSLSCKQISAAQALVTGESKTPKWIYLTEPLFLLRRQPSQSSLCPTQSDICIRHSKSSKHLVTGNCLHNLSSLHLGQSYDLKGQVAALALGIRISTRRSKFTLLQIFRNIK
eukprot:gnl/MRDRNA2_/MRDRNA2_77100_c0_seq1.p1 gnl/MRDRNA2_/MRDRNA2_77100_c0~~gnl/MRDRNA2_/MRDRNA2_77100_c0_seq1.p1  ORF type:complete len:195 (-),score=0.41 gnl/MRDRNA2_/MRDRNA2_77100_c0_seq1:89-673(-)